MIEFLKNIFTSNTIPSISFLEFYQKISRLKKDNLYPFVDNLPQAIRFPEDFWSKIVSIHKMTLQDGHEREISLFDVDGELVITTITLGNLSNVKANHNINVRYIPHPTMKNYYRKEITLDGSIYKRKDIFYKDMPKKVNIEYLFNLHTHPRHTLDNGSYYFSFVSKQDIISLLASKAVVTGLITDKLWLFVRTNKTQNTIEMPEEHISVESLKNEMGIVSYCAEFFKKGIRQ